MVSLAALAHDGEGCGFGDIWSFLTSRGFGWSGGFVLLSLLVTLAPIAVMAAMGPRPGGPGGAGMNVPVLIAAAGQWLTIVYAIAAYRAARASKDGKGPMMF